MPASEAGKHGRAGAPLRASSNGHAEATWRARYSFADLIGNGPALVHARDLALRAAQMGSTVLITGESGTGKELFAHAIHAASPRRAYPFVPVDCSAIPRELLEAELFGYAPGAFTGASREGKLGKFELAHGGTVFLDEIGEMPLEMQSKLLRVLQERQLVRVGGVTPIPVAFTAIAATNRDLDSLVADGRFRRDLLYRLDVVRIDVPSLAERSEDIPVLVEHYWACKSQELGHAPKLSAKALHVLQGYSWPGNIRELLNLLERLLVSVTKPVIEAADLPVYLRQEVVGRVQRSSFHLPTVAAEAERRTLERALQQAQGNRTDAIKLVGMSRSSFYRKLKTYGFVRHTRRSQ
jgi:transcriptional regulator with PAS, ATPase and Fis domain